MFPASSTPSLNDAQTFPALPKIATIAAPVPSVALSPPIHVQLDSDAQIYLVPAVPNVPAFQVPDQVAAFQVPAIPVATTYQAAIFPEAPKFPKFPQSSAPHAPKNYAAHKVQADNYPFSAPTLEQLWQTPASASSPSSSDCRGSARSYQVAVGDVDIPVSFGPASVASNG